MAHGGAVGVKVGSKKGGVTGAGLRGGSAQTNLKGIRTPMANRVVGSGKR